MQLQLPQHNLSCQAKQSGEYIAFVNEFHVNWGW